MLRQRIITAVLMLAVLLPALFYSSPEPFCALTLILIAAGAWEWGKLNKLSPGACVALGLIALLLCAAAWGSGLLHRPSLLLWSIVGVAWVAAGIVLIRRGVAGWAPIPAPLRVVGGLAAICLAWLAMAQARVIGIEFLLSALVLVWVADIFAYGFGRAFGRRKLSPAISPGKSWEGVWGGMGGVIVLAFAWVWVDSAVQSAGGSLYSRLWAFSPWLLVVAAVGMAAMSVVGDLVESLIKRSAGVKDSSGLLPGHGGVLDRVDALLPPLPLVMMLYCAVT
jgi:phosphatidate cytidylyltransferase